MQFFTLDWWRGRADDACDPFVDYSRHLDAIRAQLPADLLALQESISLHDSRLRQLVVLPAAETVRLVLEREEQLTLDYSQVERVESTADPDVGLAGPHGYGDLGYDEADVVSPGTFEHRLLFSSGIELALVFRGFELQREKHA